MIEDDTIAPTGFSMTTFTLAALTAAVNIGAGMTLRAGRLIFLVTRWTFVAGATDNVTMFAAQRKFGRFIVIKLFLGPALSRMATLALFAITALMFIIGAMAAVTIGWQLGFKVSVVAALAGCHRMAPG